MIKLVLVSDSSSQTPYLFSRDCVVIGNNASPTADLKLTEELADRHLEIRVQRTGATTTYTLINLAHDPFATLNGLPFGRRPLQHGDLIQLGSATLRFEIKAPLKQSTKAPEAKKETQEIDLDALLKAVEGLKGQAPSPAAEPIPLKENLSPAPLFMNVPPSFKEREPQESRPNEEVEASTPAASPKPPGRAPKLSLKDYYLSEYDEDEDGSKPSEQEKGLHKKTTSPSPQEKSPIWSKPFKILGSFLGVGLVLLFLAYIWVYDRSDDQEAKAARSASDVAMALTYANIKNIHPQNQNWSDHDFIKNMLTAVLAPEYTSFADFDQQGQFELSPYTLRIYTSSDLSQFLVIAQPSPSLIQWLAPKHPLIIDSKAMEIRRVRDLKALNRLLVNANMTEGTHAEEISAVVKHGELITLQQLADKKESFGFIPPKALAMIRPQAENLIYNAPRYYPLGQVLITKALEIVEKAASNHEVAMFHQELTALSDYEHLVLYSREGLKTALDSQKALTLLAPKDKFLMAYLQLSAKNKITSAHLLMDDAPSEVAISNGIGSGTNSVATAPNEQAEVMSASDTFKLLQENAIAPTVYRIDQRDPLFIRLSSLSTARQQALKPIAEEMIALLTKQSQTWQSQFVFKYMKLQEQYLKTNEDQYRKINSDLGAIARDMSYIPASRFVEFVKAADLQTQFQDYLTNLKQKYNPDRASEEEIDTLLKLIEQSATWNDLEMAASNLAKVLNFDNIPDEDDLIAYQNTARTRVIQKLNQFLLSRNEEALPPDAFMPEFRQVLVNILESAWIIDAETHHFYLAEFDHRSGPMRMLRH